MLSCARVRILVLQYICRPYQSNMWKSGTSPWMIKFIFLGENVLNIIPRVLYLVYLLEEERRGEGGQEVIPLWRRRYSLKRTVFRFSVVLLRMRKIAKRSRRRRRRIP